MREMKKASRSVFRATTIPARNPFAARHHDSRIERPELLALSGIGCACRHRTSFLHRCAARRPVQLQACIRGSKSRECIDRSDVGDETSCRQSDGLATTPREVSRHRSACCARCGRTRECPPESGAFLPSPPAPLPEGEGGVWAETGGVDAGSFGDHISGASLCFGGGEGNADTSQVVQRYAGNRGLASKLHFTGGANRLVVTQATRRPTRRPTCCREEMPPCRPR